MFARDTSSQTTAQLRESMAAALRLANEQAHLGEFGEVHDLLHTIGTQSLLVFLNGSPTQQEVWKAAFKKAMLFEIPGDSLLVWPEPSAQAKLMPSEAGDSVTDGLTERLQVLTQKLQSALHFLTRTMLSSSCRLRMRTQCITCACW